MLLHNTTLNLTDPFPVVLLKLYQWLTGYVLFCTWPALKLCTTLCLLFVLLFIFFLRGALPRYKLDSFVRLVWQSLIFIILLWTLVVLFIIMAV